MARPRRKVFAIDNALPKEPEGVLATVRRISQSHADELNPERRRGVLRDRQTHLQIAARALSESSMP